MCQRKPEPDSKVVITGLFKNDCIQGKRSQHRTKLKFEYKKKWGFIAQGQGEGGRIHEKLLRGGFRGKGLLLNQPDIKCGDE